LFVTLLIHTIIGIFHIDGLNIRKSLQVITDNCLTGKVTQVHFGFDYVAADRWDQVKLVAETLMRNNFASWRAQETDKQRWHSLVVNGAGGMGKTRFCFELPQLLKEYLTTNQMDNPTAKNLLERLGDVHQLYMNIGSNGFSIIPEEVKKLTPSAMLGIRVAHSYWFNDSNFQEFRNKILVSPDRNKVSLQNVLTQITHDANSPKIIHIILDEYQLLLNSKFKSEPLVKALNRALMQGVVSSTSGISNTFVMTTFCGTGYTDNTLDLEPTLYPVTRLLLTPLSIDSSRQIVNKMSYSKFDGSKVDMKAWTIQDKFTDLLTYMGGLPRALEALQEVLEKGKYSPDEVDYGIIYQRVRNALDTKFAIKYMSDEAELIPYIAMSGCPIMKDWKYQKKLQKTFKELEVGGLVQLLNLDVLGGYHVLSLSPAFFHSAQRGVLGSAPHAYDSMEI
jgi:hypothetical protein